MMVMYLTKTDFEATAHTYVHLHAGAHTHTHPSHRSDYPRLVMPDIYIKWIRANPT